MRSPSRRLDAALLATTAALGLAALASSSAEARNPAFERWREHAWPRFDWRLAADGETLWVGTNFGGVIRWNTATGEHVQYTRVENCLPWNTVDDIAVDPTSGDVWVATQRGLGRLPEGGRATDEWDVLDTTNAPFATDLFTAVAIESAGVVWAGTYDSGLYRLEGGEWTHLDPSNSGLSNPFVFGLVIDEADVKWIGAWGDGVDRHDDLTWTSFDPSTTAPVPGCDASCSDILSCAPETLGLISFFARPLEARPGATGVWVRNEDDGLCGLNGLSEHEAPAWRTFTDRNSPLISSFVEDVAHAADDTVWIASLNGTSVRTPAGWVEHPDLPAFAVESVSGDAWFGTGDGLARLRGGEVERFVPDGLAGGKVHAIAVEPDGAAAWLATDAALHRFDGTTWERFDEETSPLPTGDGRAVILTGSGDLWVGLQAFGVARREPDGTWTHFEPGVSGLCCPTITDFMEDDRGRLWASYEFGGLSRFEDGAWETLTLDDVGLPSLAVTAMARAPGGDLWFGTPRGATVFDGATWTTYTEADGLAHDSVRSLVVHPGGDVWVGTAGGLSRFDGTSFETHSVGDDVVRALAVDRDGLVWAGARQGGVAAHDGTDWTAYDVDDGLNFSRILSIASGADGRTWIGTEVGLSIRLPEASPPEPGHVPDGHRVPGIPLLVTKANPAAASLTLDWSPSCSPEAEDYSVHRGPLGAFRDHAPATCSTSGATEWTLESPPGSVYFLVVASAGEREGGYGRDSQGRARPRSGMPCTPETSEADCP